MGWRGTLRTLGAISREAERNAQRRQREHQKYLVAVEKAQKLEQAAQAVHDFETHLANLVSIHKSGPEPIDWPAYVSAEKPIEPQDSHIRESNAHQRLVSYRPHRFMEILGFAERKRRKLEQALIEARNEDEEENHRKHEDHQKAVSECEERKELGQRLLASDDEAIIEVIRTVDPFAPMSGLASNVLSKVVGHQRIAVEFEVRGETVVPKQTMTLLQSGRASVKNIPKGDYYRLYQNYVCSAVLRVARDLFAIVPVDAVAVTAKEELLNSQTGHLEMVPILSVFIPRDTFEKLNLDAIDPSDSMSNFIHKMDFRPNIGFRPVEPLDATSVGRVLD